MELHRDSWSAAKDRSARHAILADGLREAVAQNRKLWGQLRDDLSSNRNALPEALRANLLSISLWADRTCGAVIGGGEGLAALIDVNHSILAGLSAARPAVSGVDQDGAQPYAKTV